MCVLLNMYKHIHIHVHVCVCVCIISCVYVQIPVFVCGSVCEFLSSFNRLKKKNTPISCNTNYRREMKLIPFNMDYCLLQLDALNIFSEFRLHVGGST